MPRSKLVALCRKYYVRRLGLFGSAARGELGPESDIDLLVEFKAGKAPSFWADPEMREAFGALFGGRRVNLAPPEVLENPYRRKSILRDLNVLYEARRRSGSPRPSSCASRPGLRERGNRESRPARARSPGGSRS